MGLFRRKKKTGNTSSLQREAQSAAVVVDEAAPENAVSSESAQAQGQGQGQAQEQEQGQGESAAEHAAGMDLLDPGLIGRTIKLIKTDGWEEDLISVPDHETHILYENQRGYVYFSFTVFIVLSLFVSPSLGYTYIHWFGCLRIAVFNLSSSSAG